MQITVGSYVRINEQCRNRAVRGLLCRVQALECRRLSTIVPTQFAQVRVLGIEEHTQGDATEWWTPCSAIRYVGDASSCGTHDAQAAARCFLPFQLSTGTIECSQEVPQTMSVAARLRQARACTQVLRGRVSIRQEHPSRRTTPLALPILIPSEMRRLSAHEAQLATGGVSLLHCTGASITHGERRRRWAQVRSQNVCCDRAVDEPHTVHHYFNAANWPLRLGSYVVRFTPPPTQFTRGGKSYIVLPLRRATAVTPPSGPARSGAAASR